MKKIIYLIFFIISNNYLFAQVSAYSFTQGSGTFTAISGTYTEHTSGTTDYGTYTSIPIGFTFNYNCVDYTTVSISNDGYIVMGNSIWGTTTPISSSSEHNVIAAMAADLQGKSTGSLRSQTSGTAPNRTFTVEWLHYKEYYNGGNYSFQIVLHETTNVIEIYYVTSTNQSGNSFQVGLSGTTNVDFNNRTKASNNAWLSSSAGAANSDAMITGGNSNRNPQGVFTFTSTATMCSGSPSGGTASVTPSPVCSGDVVTLDLSGYSTDCGVSYQWQSATTIGGPYSDISGATTVPYNYTNSGEAYYRCVSTCSNSGGTGTSSVATLTFNSPTSCYCASTFSNTTDEWITNVTFNTINNNSGQEGANSYGDYTAISTNIEQGSSYLISVTFNSSYSQDVFVWFDWNQDGDFTDAGEEFQIADNVTTPTTNSLNISVPATATLGATRMRVMTYEFDDPGPCETASYGETEDYTVNIISSVTPMSFVSCTTTQPNTTNVGQGANNKEIICVEVVTSGMISPLSVTGFTFKTTGTTNATTDIENAKVWYTGNSSTFAPTNQFGTTVAVPPTAPTNMNIGGSQTLVGGTNYFWLSYDIQSSATVNNVVDAKCTIVQVSGNQTPTVKAPAGSRTITPPPPVSDDPCGATALVVNSGSCSYQTGDLITTTTASAGIPAPGCGSLGPDVWFKFTVPASGRVIVDLDDAGGPTDMCMAWYSSSTNDCNNIDQLIDCDDDDSQNGAMPMLCYAGAICTVPGDCQQENVLTPGMTVYVRVWDYSGGTFGPFDICAYEPDPPGAPSTCTLATTIASLPYSQSNTTCCRQNTYSSSVGCGSSYQDGEDFLYKYTPSVNQNIDITLTGTDSYTGVFVTDGCPDVGACVASQTESGGNPMLCGVSLTAGTTYYIMIDNDPAPDCTPFNISISESTTPTCGLNYTISSTSYSWDNFFGTNIVLPVDDRFNDAYIPIPFKFCYDGYQATQLLVSSNGYIIFDPIGCSTNLPSTNAAPNAYSGYSISSAIPNTTNAPRNAILGPWHDINPAVGGTISYGVLGSAPNRRFVVSWEDAPLYGTSCGDLCTQQIKLYETTNDIEVHMKDKKLCTGWNSGAAIMGLHNYNGTIARVPAGYNYPTTWSAHHEAWKFTCNCTGCIVPLPIDLIDFKGECYQNNIELTWTTVSEENNQTFTIEKSVDAINFASIGTVNGAGNSNELHNYSFMDKNNGYDNVYYRLKQTDFDGESKTTKPIVVKCNSMTNNILVLPNPVNENEPITVLGNFHTLSVKNVLGSDIKVKIEENKILGLPKGVYFIVIDEYYITKIVVQ